MPWASKRRPSTNYSKPSLHFAVHDSFCRAHAPTCAFPLVLKCCSEVSKAYSVSCSCQAAGHISVVDSIALGSHGITWTSPLIAADSHFWNVKPISNAANHYSRLTGSQKSLGLQIPRRAIGCVIFRLEICQCKVKRSFGAGGGGGGYSRLVCLRRQAIEHATPGGRSIVPTGVIAKFRAGGGGSKVRGPSRAGLPR